MKTLFLDTNVLMQCQKLEQLPWDEISKHEDIMLLISRSVQEEIDHMKHDGNSRRAKRSRSATTFIRSILLSQTSKVAIRGSDPHVDVGFAPPVALKESPFPFLDLSRTDDRIIVEAIWYRDQHPQEEVALLTHDTQPMVTSKNCGLAFIAVPDTWLLPPEPDDRDKKIAELDGRLRKFERAHPVIEIAFKDASGTPLRVASFNVMCYPTLSSAEIEELTKLVVSHHPITTDFDRPAPTATSHRFAGIDVLNLTGIQRRYEPPSEEEIHKYAKESYPDWVENVKGFFKSLPSKLEFPTREYRFWVSIYNNGYSPAENVLVEFNLSRGLFLMPTDDEHRQAKANPLVLPKPPTPPAGRWVQSLSPFESMAASARALSIHAGSPFDRGLLDLSRYQQPKHDKNAFYCKPEKPTRPMTAWAFECDEFRHRAEPEDFEIRIRVPADDRPVRALFECRVSARNLHDPVADSLPVKIEYEDQDSLAAAKTYLQSGD